MDHKNHKKIDSPDQIYTCPMHPEVKRDKPDMCPKCGMNLVPVNKKQVANDRDTHNKYVGQHGHCGD